MDREALKRELTEQFHQSLDQTIDAVEKARDGAWIADSEWEVRDAFEKLMAQAFERVLQSKLDTAEKAVAFSPSRPPEQGTTRHRPAQRRR